MVTPKFIIGWGKHVGILRTPFIIGPCGTKSLNCGVSTLILSERIVLNYRTPYQKIRELVAVWKMMKDSKGGVYWQDPNLRKKDGPESNTDSAITRCRTANKCFHLSISLFPSVVWT